MTEDSTGGDDHASSSSVVVNAKPFDEPPSLSKSTSSETTAAPSSPKQKAIIRRSNFKSDVNKRDNVTHGVLHAIDSTSQQKSIHMWLKHKKFGQEAADHFYSKKYDTFLWTPYSSMHNWNEANPKQLIFAMIQRKGEGTTGNQMGVVCAKGDWHGLPLAEQRGGNNYESDVKQDNHQGLIDVISGFFCTGSYLSMTIKVILVTIIVFYIYLMVSIRYILKREIVN